MRRQATLFLRAPKWINEIRRELNPVQANLISPHVTLCREDEVSDWGELARRLCELPTKPFTLDFGHPYRKQDLVYLPCTGSTKDFDILRDTLLNSSAVMARQHHPHLTLVHPRNGFCSDRDFESIVSASVPFSYTFDEVTFIRQVNGGVWETLEVYKLGMAANR